MALTYDQCPCGGTYEHRWVEVRMMVDGQHTILEQVPQGCCPWCASRVYKVVVLGAIESTMKGTCVDGRLLETIT